MTLASNASPTTSEEPLLRIATELACQNARALCSQHLDELYYFWVTLCQSKITIAKLEPDWHEHAVDIFRNIDNYIFEKEEVPELQRIGYIGLAILMEEVKRAIAISRRRGGIESRRGQRNASLALDLYLAAQGPSPNLRRARNQLSRRVAASRRWRALSTCCPLLPVICTGKAESIM